MKTVNPKIKMQKIGPWKWEDNNSIYGVDLTTIYKVNEHVQVLSEWLAKNKEEHVIAAMHYQILDMQKRLEEIRRLIKDFIDPPMPYIGRNKVKTLSMLFEDIEKEVKGE